MTAVVSIDKARDAAEAARERVGVLLVNLGTPDTADARGVRVYLKEFLSDPRVIEDQGLRWKLILNGIILRVRPARKARDYLKIWNTEKNESPLKTITRAQADKLAAAISDHDRVVVDWAMRYGNPGVAGAVEKMMKAGCHRILAAPLYPQYCAATTASAQDALFAALADLRWQPALRTLPPYFDDSLYIEALRASVQRQLSKLPFEPQRLLLSFHGMPQRTLELGDPYHCHCQKTARLLGEQLAIPTDIAFQSRFGRAKWLEPSTESVLASYPQRGIARIAIAAPGFSADCVETLEELEIRGRENFLAAGGEQFARLDCLNDSAEGIAMLERLIRRELAGWLPAE